MSPTTVLLEATDLVQRIGHHRPVDGVSLRLAAGELLGLLGVNGAGKSSTLRLLAGLRVPDHGQVRVLGRDPARDPAARATIGYLPDQPGLLRELSLLENLEDQTRLYGLCRARARQRIATLVEALELGPIQHRLAGQLSRGQAQRAALALALLHEPALLLLDEPTTGIDPLQVMRLRELLRALAPSTGVLFSSHQLGEVELLCDRVLLMHQGRLHDDVAAAPRAPAVELELDAEVDAGFWHGLELAPTPLGGRHWRISCGPEHLRATLDHVLARQRLPLRWGPAASTLEQRFLAVARGEVPR